MPPKETKTGTKSVTHVVRAVGPMVPLAIALLHGAMTGSTDTVPASVAPTPVAANVMVLPQNCGAAGLPSCRMLSPLLQKGHPVDWWFVFKFNSAAFPGCGSGADRTCPFGGQ